MQLSTPIHTLNSGHLIYAGHREADEEGDGFTFVLFDRGARGSGSYVVLDPDGEFYKALCKAESPGKYYNEMKKAGELEVKEVSGAYPQALDFSAKTVIPIPELTGDAIFDRLLNSKATFNSIQKAGIDTGDLYVILPESVDDEVLDSVRTNANVAGLERGRILRGRTQGNNAMWIANIGELVLNFTVDDDDEEEEEDEPQGMTLGAAVKTEERKRKVKEFVDGVRSSKGKNHERRWQMDDNTPKDLMLALLHAVNKLAEDVGIPVQVHIPSDVPGNVVTTLRENGIEVYDSNKTPPRNAGVLFVTEGDE